MANRMSTEKRNTIQRLLVEGNSIRSVTRLMSTNIPSVLRQLVWAGDHCRELLETRMVGLELNHLEVDEMWTFCRKKQARLTIEEKAIRHDIGDVYLWYGIDQKTKLAPTYLLGKRSADNARRFMMNLAGCLEQPNPHESDAHAFGAGGYKPSTQLSTDGFTGYPEAVDLAFGPHVRYGQIIKDYRNAEQPGRYAPPEIVGTDRRGIFGINEDQKWSICTSHVERHNLTVRTFMRRITRLALGFSKKLENLDAACALHMAYYNFCWRPGKMRITPAMAAGATNKLWRFDDLMAGGLD